MIKLIIVGPERWSGTTEERDSLKKKLESYVVFVEGGQLLNTYPQAKGFSVHFQIDTPVALPAPLQTWIQEIAAVLGADHGIDLQVLLVDAAV